MNPPVPGSLRRSGQRFEDCRLGTFPDYHGKNNGIHGIRAGQAGVPCPPRTFEGLERVRPAHAGGSAAGAGRPLHGLRHSVLPHGCAHGAGPGRVRLSAEQSHTGLERPGLPGPLERSPGAVAQDQQLPRVHRPRVPGPLRGILCPGDQQQSRHHQDHRVRHRRPGLRGRLDQARTARGTNRKAGGGPWFRSLRSGLRGPAQPRRAPGHGVRTVGPGRRAVDVRHPQHEARQGAGGGEASESDGGRGGRVRHRRGGRQGRPRRRPSARVRRSGDLHRRHQAQRLRAQRPGPRPGGHLLRHGLPQGPTPRACWTRAMRTATTFRPRTSTPSSWAAATPAPTAWERRCATDARASNSST